MTKEELLHIGEYSDYVLFQTFVENYRNRIRSLSMGISSSIWNTRLLSYSQIRRLRKLSEDLEKFYREMLKWEFHGKNEKIELFPLDK